MDPVNVTAKFEVSGYTRFWDSSDWSFWSGLRTPNLREKEAVRGRGWYRSKKAVVSSYRPYIVTLPLTLRVSEILPLLCSSTPLFPTPPLVSAEFPHVPMGLGVGGMVDGLWPLGCEERRC